VCRYREHVALRWWEAGEQVTDEEALAALKAARERLETTLAGSGTGAADIWQILAYGAVLRTRTQRDLWELVAWLLVCGDATDWQQIEHASEMHGARQRFLHWLDDRGAYDQHIASWDIDQLRDLALALPHRSDQKLVEALHAESTPPVDATHDALQTGWIPTAAEHRFAVAVLAALTQLRATPRPMAVPHPLAPARWWVQRINHVEQVPIAVERILAVADPVEDTSLTLRLAEEFRAVLRRLYTREAFHTLNLSDWVSNPPDQDVASIIAWENNHVRPTLRDSVLLAEAAYQTITDALTAVADAAR
jgi:hypothetical protein